ncbi:MAG: penicillin acylase family protein [Acidobacteria bacterium]|nr:penicillin acylase family protein [Acidobacteriota bacterium]
MTRLLVTTLLVLVIAAGLGATWWTRQSLPAMDGEVTMPGLQDPVETIFDSYGVPHVYARDPEDAWFAAGVLHARERLWQMELYRRVTAGRLSEVLGADTLPIDKRFLTLDLRAAAEAEWQRATPAVKTALERYAAGVNTVASRWVSRERPLEFQVLGITPSPWTPVDSLAIGRLLAWRLAENHQAELVRAAIAEKLGPDSARQLSGRYPAGGPTIAAHERETGGGRREADLAHESPAGTADVSGTEQRSGQSFSRERTPSAALAIGRDDVTRKAPRLRSGQADERSEKAWPVGLEWLNPGARRGNSNNWVVAGSRTASGRPILANDPHLLVEFPSVWYEMHLVAAGLDVIGVTIPGVPFVVIGHNRRVAWGFTNSNADVQDVYLERVDVARKRVMSGGAWQAAQVTRVEIPVKGAAAEPFDVWRTPRGPIFADVGLDWQAPPAWMTPGAAEAPGQASAYALRWAGVDGDTAAAFELLNRATDWATFTAAIDRFDTPSQNVVYADVDGNIGYALSGRLPVRLGSDGTTVQSGNAGSGWASADAGAPYLPRVLNPASGYFASANNEVGGGGALITRDWAAPYRAERLHAALAEVSGATVAGMTALQQDTTSLAARQVLAGVQDALTLARGQGADASAIDTLEQLAAWDHVVDARPVVTLYEAFEHALWRRTFVDEMDEPLFRVFYEWAGAERPAGLYAIIDERQSRWFDDIATVEKRESRSDIFVLAARDAAERVEADFGSGSGRAWDRVHTVTFEHALGSGSRVMSWLFSRGPVPMVGDGTTVMRVSWNRLRPFAGWEAPSWRQVLDVGQWDDSRVVLPTGQSGHRWSPHHFDQNELWRTGQTRPQPFSRQAVVAAQAHRLVMVGTE